MAATILDGRTLAASLREEVTQDVAAFQEKHGVSPSLAVVRAGEDPASVSYARMISKTCERVGVEFAAHVLSESATEGEIASLVADLSADQKTDGIMIQEPLPKGVRSEGLMEVLNHCSRAELTNLSVTSMH